MTDKFKLHFPTLKEDGEYIPPYINLELPLNFRFGYASKTLADFKDELLERIEVKESQIFSLIGLLGNSLAMHEDCRTDEIGEYIELLSGIGRGFNETLAMVREGFDEENAELAEKEKAKETVLDLSDIKTDEGECIDLAKHLSAVLKDEKTPTALYNAIVDGLSSFNLPTEFVDSPEYLEKILCQEAKDE